MDESLKEELEMGTKEITVRELLDKLTKYPLDAIVRIEGEDQPNTYMIGYIWMNIDHTKVYIHGRV